MNLIQYPQQHLPIEITFKLGDIAQHVAEIEAYFSSMSLKLEDYADSLDQNSKINSMEPLQELIKVIKEFNEQIYNLIQEINPKIDHLQVTLIEKWKNKLQKPLKEQIYEIPVELERLQLSKIQKESIVEEYFMQIKTLDQLPPSIKNIFLLQNKKNHSFFSEIPIEAQTHQELDAKYEKENRGEYSYNISMNLTFQNKPIVFQMKKNDSQEQLINQQGYFEHTENVNTLRIIERSPSEIKTASFYDEQASQEIQSSMFNAGGQLIDKIKGINLSQKLLKSKQQLTISHKDKKLQGISFEKQKNKRTFNFQNQKFAQNSEFVDKLGLSSQVYALSIYSKMSEIEEKKLKNSKKDMQQKQEELTFSNQKNYVRIRKPHYKTKSNVRKNSQNCFQVLQKNGYNLSKKQNCFGRLSENHKKSSNEEGSKKNQVQSFFCNDFSMTPKNNDLAPPINNNINWSASIQSFVMGANTKNLAESYNFTTKKPLKIEGCNSRQIQQQSGEDYDNPFYLRIPVSEPHQNTPVKNQRLTQHPELNFCGSSEINEQNSPNQQVSKTQSFLKSQPEKSVSLKFKQSCIIRESNHENKCIDPTGSVYGSLVELAIAQKKGYQDHNEKKNNKVFIFEAQSSSQGSHTDREMYVSNIKKINAIIDLNKSLQKQSSSSSSKWINRSKGEEISSESANKSVQNLRSTDHQIYEQYYELKQIKVSLQQQKTLLIEQLRASEEKIEKLLNKVQEQQNQKINIQQCYKEKLHQIIQQISVYEQNLRVLQDQLNKKIKSQSALSELLEQNNHKVHELESQLHKKMQKIGKLEQLNSQVEILYYQSKQIHEKSSLQKELAIQQMSQEYTSQNQILMQEVENYRLKVNFLEHQLLKSKEIIEGKNEKIEEQKNMYNQLFLKLEAMQIEKQQYREKQYFQIYNEELQKTSLQFEKLLKDKTIAINQLIHANQQLNKHLIQKNKAIQILSHKLQVDNKLIQEFGCTLNSNNEQINQIFSLLPTKVKQQIQYLRSQNVTTSNKLLEAENKVKHLQGLLSPRIQFISSKTNADENEKDQQYARKLEEIVLFYEQLIEKSHCTIKQLQQRVYQYLRDALKKQESEEKMYEESLQYQNELNQLLLQKIRLQKQNKKMKKMILASQKKLSSIGTRLINAANNKLKDFSRQTSNETQKHFKNVILTNNKMFSNRVKKLSSHQTLQEILIDTLTK